MRLYLLFCRHHFLVKYVQEDRGLKYLGYLSVHTLSFHSYIPRTNTHQAQVKLQ